jgi:hypothetical protein
MALLRLPERQPTLQILTIAGSPFALGIGIGRERAAGANLANKRGTRRVFISELLRPRAEIDIERPSASWL